MRPPVGACRPTTQRAIVVLPEPDSPTSATHSPRPTANDTSEAATTVPARVRCSARSSSTASSDAAPASVVVAPCGGTCWTTDVQLPADAAHPPAGVGLQQRRHGGVAVRHVQRAARRERAARRPLAHADGHALDAAQLARRRVVGDRRHETAGVGMPRAAQHLLRRALLDDAPRVHDGDAVRRSSRRRRGRATRRPSPGRSRRAGGGSRPGCGPGSRRRGPSSARRAPPPAARRPAPRRWRPAAAGRRRAGGGSGARTRGRPAGARARAPRPTSCAGRPRSISRIWSAMRKAGLSAAPGFWGT